METPKIHPPPAGDEPGLEPAEPLLVFVHIQKTAGKTIRQILYRQYSRPRTYHVRNYFVAPEVARTTMKELAASPPADVRAVHGHILFWRDRWPEETRFLAMLRDPVERVVSHYFWLRARSSKFSKSLEEAIIEGPILDNLQTRVLAASMPPLGETRAKMLETALESLERLTVVGLTERFDESLVLATRALGWRRMLYRSNNATPGRRPTSEIPAKTIDLIKQQNAFDLELYDRAAERFEEDVARQGGAFEIEVAALRRASELAERADGTDLGPLPSTIAAGTGVLGEPDLRALLIEAQAQLLQRDEALEQLAAAELRPQRRQTVPSLPDPVLAPRSPKRRAPVGARAKKRRRTTDGAATPKGAAKSSPKTKSSARAPRTGLGGEA